ncbi:hypothetical protein EW026_g2412 [Hermanssonia centrifuga]|uniref:Phosphoinositide phospholipase C n=1 Tax=Hermanssonia centrifuga TaxID=98765 RepID=A0A4S4KQA0_9APHY|nr:hypothetical protein EW026_g2412 [Hermanssonia centrifuga]
MVEAAAWTPARQSPSDGTAKERSEGTRQHAPQDDGCGSLNEVTIAKEKEKQLSITQEPPSQPSSSPASPTAHMDDFAVPRQLLNGVPMLKVSEKKQKSYFFRLDPDQGQILWYSKKLRIIPIETIKEIRTGSDARYYREQYRLASSYEDRWLTLIYVLDGSYKTLHIIAATRETFQAWDSTVRRLYEIRKQLMSGLGHGEMRQAVWEKQFWKAADEEDDSQLDFDDLEKLCRRLNINPSRDELLRRFKQADIQNRGYLDFTDFRKFVKALKARPELDRVFKKLVIPCGSTDGTLRYPAFASFMREKQRSGASEDALQRLFVKYASPPGGEVPESSSCPPHSPARNALELAIRNATITAGFKPPTTSHNPSDASTSHLSVSSATSPPEPQPPSSSVVTYETGVLTRKGFTSFLLSTDNSVFKSEQHDMTRPLPEYFVSSSHNTYLVGHQLVGESTIEGYIRALLHSCRSVELDIYDGEIEPVIYHGKTFTSKVALRDICEAINRYAFVSSPYPIIISAEVHCCVTQQVMMAKIMSEVFGDALVQAPVDGRPKIEVLPSPEDLKGRVLLKVDPYACLVRDITKTCTLFTGEEFSELTKAKNALGRVKVRRLSNNANARPALSPALGSSSSDKPKVKMAIELLALLVYTVGVKCRGLNKKEVYAPEHMFSLSESTANKILKQSMMDLIKHNRAHLVRIYPKGMRIGSTNYEPHRYWSAGAQLVAINWQTFDLGYMINHAMFQRNNRAGFVHKPPALRNADKNLLAKRTKHCLDVTIISAQQLPRVKDSLGREILGKSILDPFVEISIHIPDWTHSPFLPSGAAQQSYSPPSGPSSSTATTARTLTLKTGVVKNNGFNPVWEQTLSLPFDCVGNMLDLVFVRFAVKQEDKEDEEPLAVYCSSLASLNFGYRHLPLHDAQLSQYLFSTLFVNINIRDA